MKMTAVQVRLRVADNSREDEPLYTASIRLYTGDISLLSDNEECQASEEEEMSS